MDEEGQPVATGRDRRAGRARVARDARLLADAGGDGRDAAARALPGERVLHTGDLFRRDEDGYLYFVGRGGRHHQVERREGQPPRGGERAVPPRRASRRPPSSASPTRCLGQAVKAVVVLARPTAALTARDVQRHCAGCLEDFMVPAVVEFRAELPKTDNGKILKASLRMSPVANWRRGRRDRGSLRMESLRGFSKDALQLDAAAEADRICGWIRADGSWMQEARRGRRVLRRHRQQRRRLRSRCGRWERRTCSG